MQSQPFVLACHSFHGGISSFPNFLCANTLKQAALHGWRNFFNVAQRPALFAGVFSPLSQEGPASLHAPPPSADIATVAILIMVILLLFILLVLNRRKKKIIINKSKALRESEARYRLLFEHAPIPLLEADYSAVKTFVGQLADLGITDLNRYFAENPDNLARCSAMIRVLNANRATLTLYRANHHSELSQLIFALPKDQNIPFSNEIHNLARSGGSEIVIKNKTLRGRELTVERRVAIAAGHESSWEKIFVTLLNITEQEHLKTENLSFEKQLQQTQKLEAIGSLAGGIAHDFNNILAPIMGRAELMQSENPGNACVLEHCRGILDASKRARNLVKQILTFSRQVDQEIVPVSLVDIVNEVIQLVHPALPAAVEIDFPPPEIPPWVMADATQLHQVVMNLVTNAFHAMEEHGGRLSLRIDTVTLGVGDFEDFSIPPGVYRQLCVEDNGHGMESATLSKIFDPYFTTKPFGKGTGLGLAVVLGIVRSYGGDIMVKSQAGKGTVFTLYFPAIEFADNQFPITNKHQEPMPHGTEHILLVDDEKSVADVTTSMLERLGYKVTVRISSYDALEAFRNLADQIDLLIADLTMPQMTGLQLYREIKKIRPGVKVIICTGFSEQLDDRKSKAIGIEGFLYKPVVMADLAWCIRSVLDE